MHQFLTEKQIWQALNFSTLDFYIPSSKKEIIFTSNAPFYYCILELLNAHDLVNIIKAILLEKTIVFVGNEDQTSSFILGLNQFISPFKWCFSSIPILPMALIDMLEAPIPLIVGITEQQYQTMMQEEYTDLLD